MSETPEAKRKRQYDYVQLPVYPETKALFKKLLEQFPSCEGRRGLRAADWLVRYLVEAELKRRHRR